MQAETIPHDKQVKFCKGLFTQTNYILSREAMSDAMSGTMRDALRDAV
jgi:hypothetical protein